MRRFRWENFATATLSSEPPNLQGVPKYTFTFPKLIAQLIRNVETEPRCHFEEERCEFCLIYTDAFIMVYSLYSDAPKIANFQWLHNALHIISRNLNLALSEIPTFTIFCLLLSLQPTNQQYLGIMYNVKCYPSYETLCRFLYCVQAEL